MGVRSWLAVSVVVAMVAGAAVPVADATVPPRNCGPLKVGSRQFIIKADQIRCPTAKSDAKAYIVSRKKPKGFKCRNYTGSKLTFRCQKGVKVFFAIRR